MKNFNKVTIHPCAEASGLSCSRIGNNKAKARANELKHNKKNQPYTLDKNMLVYSLGR